MFVKGYGFLSFAKNMSKKIYYIDVVMPTLSLTEYSDIYLKTSGHLWQYYRDEPDLDNASNITDFPANNNDRISFKFK